MIHESLKEPRIGPQWAVVLWKEAQPIGIGHCLAFLPKQIGWGNLWGRVPLSIAFTFKVCGCQVRWWVLNGYFFSNDYPTSHRIWKHAIGTRWLAYRTRGHSHFPRDFWSWFEYSSCSSSKWSFLCPVSGHVGPPQLCCLLSLEWLTCFWVRHIIFVLGVTPNHILLKSQVTISHWDKQLNHAFLPYSVTFLKRTHIIDQCVVW